MQTAGYATSVVSAQTDSQWLTCLLLCHVCPRNLIGRQSAVSQRASTLYIAPGLSVDKEPLANLA